MKALILAITLIISVTEARAAADKETQKVVCMAIIIEATPLVAIYEQKCNLESIGLVDMIFKNFLDIAGCDTLLSYKEVIPKVISSTQFWEKRSNNPDFCDSYREEYNQLFKNQIEIAKRYGKTK